MESQQCTSAQVGSTLPLLGAAIASFVLLGREWMGLDRNGWEWMGMGLFFIVMDWIIPHSLLSTSKLLKALFSVFNVSFLINS